METADCIQLGIFLASLLNTAGIVVLIFVLGYRQLTQTELALEQERASTKEALRAEHNERRFEVYRLTSEYFVRFLVNTPPETSSLTNIRKAADLGHFLLEADLRDFLKQASNVAFNLWIYDQFLKSGQPESQKKRIYKNFLEASEWTRRESEAYKECFEKYLSLKGY